MAWFAVTSLMRTVELEFLPPNPHVVLEDTEEAEKLHQRLHKLLDFLEKSEDQFNADDVPMPDWKAWLKGVALKIEDAIELNVVDHCSKEKEVFDHCSGGRSRSTIAGSFHSTLVYANKELTQFENGIVSSTERIESSSSRSSLPTTSELQSTMVGRTAELERIKRLLLDDKSKERLVIPILGMAGIGKTTFARSLYQDPLVISHFDVLAWATVSTSATYDSRRTLRELLLCIDTEKKEFIHLVNHDLPDLVRKRLVGKRYLIVLDDIWNNGHWDEIKRSFPEDPNGSRILLTSRLDEVAMYTRSNNYCSLNLSFLNPKESWNLFLQKIHPPRLPSEVKETWKHIVDSFEGLPFAIVIAAGLAQVATNESQRISKEIGQIFYGRMCNELEVSISKILMLSYNNLPNFLKICFLYLGIFPQGSTILVTKLVKLWIAEGFVKVEGQRSLEEVAEDSLKDLVSRSLVLIDKISLGGKIKTCKVHDIVHHFCKRKATEEDLLHVVDGGHSRRLDTFRWVSFEKKDASLISNTPTGSRSRSILCFCRGVDGSFIYFNMLRVLDLSSTPHIQWNRVFTCVYVIPPLFLLRYLALYFDPAGQQSETCLFQTSFNLQTLLLLLDKRKKGAYYKTIMIPGVWRLPRLRHLQFSPMFTFESPIIVLECLQTIYWLRPFQCKKQVFLRIPNTKVMGIFIPKRIYWDLPSDGDNGSDDDNWLVDLINLKKLEKLKINSDRHGSDPIKLPSASAFPATLRVLTLKGVLLPWHDIEKVVGKLLPNLQVLKLKEGACSGLDWEALGGGFPNLKSLLIQGMELKQWTATDEDAFPILESLIIKHCYNLKKIPPTFADLCTLQLIELHSCDSLLVRSAKELQELRLNLIGDNLFVVRDYNTRQAASIEEEKQAKR